MAATHEQRPDAMGSTGSKDAEPATTPASEALLWARSGAMALTGTADGPALGAPGGVATCMATAAGRLWRLARRLGGGLADPIDGPALLGERAALADPPLRRRGRVSVGGACRLLRCRDGWVALNLARPEDRTLLDAWLEAALPPARHGDGGSDDAFDDALAEAVQTRDVATLTGRAALLGLAAAGVGRAADVLAPGTPWCRVVAHGPTRARPIPRPLVVDLSSLWAGPLAGDLLAASGARVVKVESVERPDGARRGDPRFFDRLNGAKESVALELAGDGGRRALAALVDAADIVIESSRPRALLHFGIDAAAVVAARPGKTWLSITGHGRVGDAASRVAFGDDAAAAAGLVAHDASGDPVFCGDAIADPLTGLHAATAVLASHGYGGGRLLDVALCRVAAHALQHAPAAPFERAHAAAEPEAPRARAVTRSAPPLGHDTEAVLAEIGFAC